MTARACLTDTEVAAKLGRTREWFMQHKKRMIDELGFPPPIPMLRRWDSRAIDRWLDNQMPADLRPDPVETGESAVTLSILEDEEDLVARAAEMATH